MKKKLLVIRSVSFQQLDKNLEAIETNFPVSNGSWEFHLLTHAHGVQRAKSYQAISRIIDYGSRKNFTVFHLPQCLKKKKEVYDGVMVPVTNKTAVGFLNVLVMALRIPSASIYICNLTSRIWKISRKKILLQALKSCIFSFLSLVFIIPFLVIFLLVLPLSFIIGRWRKKKGT